MWISNYAIRNPVITTVVVLSLVVFGTIALLVLDTDEFPEVQPPVIAVSIAYPGASPETVERELVEPLEDGFRSISGVDEITSTSMDSFAQIVIEFDFEKDLQQASQDIRDKISEIRQDLPLEMEEPVIVRFDPGDLPIVSLTLSSPQLSATELTRIADPGLTAELRALTGVADVKLVGGVERELVVELDPSSLQASGVGIQQVVTALREQNLAAPVGRVTGDVSEHAIRLRGRLETPADFEDLVVSRSGGTVLRLGQLARVYDGAEEPRSGALYNGRPAVGIDVVKALGYSTTAVSARVKERTSAIAQTLPEGVELRVVRDAGVRVARSVRDVQMSLAEGALLTVLVVFLFLNSWRSTVITGLALPVSVLASFVAVLAFGFTLNTMSLLGLSLAIGILIDDAIVVRENIVRHMEMGKDHTTAAREGTAEIGLAVAATTFSIVVVFIPIAFMGGVAEQWFAPFALTIACSVLVSLFVSFSLDPMLSAIWPDPEIAGGKKSFITRRLARFNAAVDRGTSSYKRVIAWALGHRALMVAIALASFLTALAMPAVGLIGSEFFPEQDRSEFSMRIEAPPGSNLEYTLLKAEEASRLAQRHPEVLETYATVGGQTGEEVDVASVYVRLVPKAERKRSQTQIAKQLRAEIGRIGGITASLETGGFGPQKQIQVEIQGPDLAVLSELSERVADEVRKVPGAVDVGLSSRGQRPEFVVDVDRDLAGAIGVTIQDVAQALRPAFAGIDAGDWVDPSGETRDVVVRLAPAERMNRADLESLPLLLTGGAEPAGLPLGQVAGVREALGPNQIRRLDGRRVIAVEANTEDRPLSEVVAGIDERLASIGLPPGYEISQGGETEDQREVFGRILVSLAVAVMLMYVVLVIQFRSFLDPVPIMASLPLSLIGVMLALLVTGSTLNLMSMIGVILLMGIVAKNAILLIDFAKWRHEAGMERKAAIVEAGGVRLRPILMTSVAIIAGMTPIAVGAGEGADFRAPLGRAVIGGVVTATLLTLLVIPTFYDVLAGLRERLRARLSGRRVRTRPPPALPEGRERTAE